MLCESVAWNQNTLDELEFYEQPEIANVLSFNINTRLLARKITPDLQQLITAFLHSEFIRAKATVGYITFHQYAAISNVSPYEDYLGYTFPEVAATFRQHVRGCYWGNWLRREQIDLLGGFKRLQELRFAIARELSADYYYVQLTEDLYKLDEATIRVAHNFFSPLFLRPKLIKPGLTLENYFEQFMTIR